MNLFKKEVCEKKKNGDKQNTLLLLALLSLVILGLVFQLQAFYLDYIIKKSRIESPGLMICFHSPYYRRWVVQLLGILGLGLSCAMLYKRSWNFPDSVLSKFIHLSPVLILLIDQLLSLKILK